jgi:hypothetical protein
MTKFGACDEALSLGGILVDGNDVHGCHVGHVDNGEGYVGQHGVFAVEDALDNRDGRPKVFVQRGSGNKHGIAH